jgi:hypothetical protein
MELFDYIVGMALRGHPIRFVGDFFQTLRNRSDGAATECRPYKIGIGSLNRNIASNSMAEYNSAY